MSVFKEIVTIPENEKVIALELALGVKRISSKEGEGEEVKEPDPQPLPLCQCQQPAAVFPLELVRPDTVRYRQPDGQTVEFTLPRKPFLLLEFVMGQKDMSEDMEEIALKLWNARGNCTKTIDQARMKVNECLRQKGIPFLLFRKNGYITLKKTDVCLFAEKI